MLRRGVLRLKDRAQLIVDDIEMNKSDVTAQLDGAAPTCDDAQCALTTINPVEVARLCSDRQRQPSPHVARVMDCVLLVFHRPVNAVTMDVDRPSVKPAWNESLKVSIKKLITR